eukprot:TRINITY_DN8509_c0_g1_i5.p1 TRINITY_DN8509_c0_g1~~TRINITY_DN8509_c0_g1_i5.p1  ORF type:complete len:218 (-),score=37.93 TRINITY_DN8509_c0_g1_i5:24-677(-)
MARSLEIKPGEVVMDPMCGSGIVLLEAAQCWRHAFYLGFDVEPSQLERSVANTKLLAGHIGRTISIQRGDASRLPLSSGSVDAVVCDLPFGKQFGSEAVNERLYPAAVREFQRVLRPGTGRVALLTNQANLDRLCQVFLANPEQWAVTCRRKIKLGNMESILVLAEARAAVGREVGALPPESMRLPWEEKDRGRNAWGSQKAAMREAMQPVIGRFKV